MLIHEVLGIEYPIFQGAMANISDGKFAASVSEAGALGIIAAGALDKEGLRKEIHIAKSITKKPFGVNVMLMSPYVDEIIDVIVEEKIQVVTTGAGSPIKYLGILKSIGCKVFPVCASVVLAKRMERAGVDGIIAEGTESGGHVGEATTMSLLPQMVEALSIPIIAAGGIANGNQMIATLAMGACGIQMGTRFLASQECPIHKNYKNAVLTARDNDTTVTGRSLGAPVRILKNKMSREYLELEKNLSSRDELEKITIGALRKAVFDGDIERGSLMMGQIAGLIKDVKPVKNILIDIMTEARNSKMKLQEIYKELGE